VTPSRILGIIIGNAAGEHDMDGTRAIAGLVCNVPPADGFERSSCCSFVVPRRSGCPWRPRHPLWALSAVGPEHRPAASRWPQASTRGAHNARAPRRSAERARRGELEAPGPPCAAVDPQARPPGSPGSGPLPCGPDAVGAALHATRLPPDHGPGLRLSNKPDVSLT
jgi:hypothetical protein